MNRTALRDAALQYIHEHRENALVELKHLLSFPTVSTDPEHQQDLQNAARWLAERLQGLGFEARVYPTGKHPIVFAENRSAGEGAPVVLIYGHYDVQPVEPLDLWKTDPFQATIQGQHLYARGASDMKGQVIATLEAVEAVLKTGNAPVNFKYLLEGEEEIGSPSLAGFLKEHASELSADVVLNPDSGMIAPDIPTITYGLRGLAYFELRVYGPEHDLHSGMFGGVVHNPAQALTELIAGMHDEQGRVTLPGFYDKVRPLSAEERSELSRLPMGEDFYKRQTGAPTLWGEPEYQPVERAGGRPTLEVHGLLSGFTGTGTKTVIPAWAMAKLSSRLVPDQDPEEVYEQLKQYLERKAPKSIRWELTFFGGGPAVITKLDLPATRALAGALESVWGVEPVYKREGGSIPVVVEMQEILGVQSVITGFGLPDDNVHAPNEKLDLETWYRGMDALALFFYNVAEMGA